MLRLIPIFVGLAACGPSQEEVQACSTAKGLVAQAWGAYAQVARTQAAQARERLQAGQGLLELSERMAAEITDPAMSAELRTKNAASRAHVDARRALADAQDAAAAAATTVQAAWGGKAIEGIRAELAANAALDAADAADQRLVEIERAQGGIGLPDRSFSDARMAAMRLGHPAMQACEKVEPAGE